PKPFRVTALATALTQAYLHRLYERKTVLYVGEPQPAENPIVQGLAVGTGIPWNIFVQVRTFEELLRYVETNRGTVGALLIDPIHYKTMGRDWLAPFTKSVLARMVTLVCLSRDAKVAEPLRTYCHLFVDSSRSADDWTEIFSRMALRA